MSYHLFHRNLYSNIEYWFGVPELSTGKIYYDGEFESVQAAKASIGHIQEIPDLREDGPNGPKANNFGTVKGTSLAEKVESFINNDKYSGTFYVIFKGPIKVHYKKDQSMQTYRKGWEVPL